MRHPLEYFVESSTWSAGGLLLGYVLGRIETRVRKIARKVGADDDDDT